MSGKRDPARELHVRQAAYLRGQYNLSQSEIGRILGGFSQAHVSRLLKLAERRGYLVTTVRFVGEGIPAADLAALRRLHESPPLALALEALERRDGSPMPRVHVFDSGSRADSAMAQTWRRRRFGRAAAGRLHELLREVESVGIAWGSTVAGLIEGLAKLRTTVRSERPLTIVPVCAEILGLASPEYSSTRLSIRLGEVVARPLVDTFSLSGVPAYLPRSLGEEKSAVIRDFVSDSDSYRAIFGTPDPLIERLDGLITSISSTGRPVGGDCEELLRAGGIDADTLQSLIVGDIGGALLPRASLTPDRCRLLDELNRMWTGVSLDHMATITHRARTSGRGIGCVVVAVGRERAAVAYEVLRRGLASEMLVDHDLAAELERLIRQHLG